MIISTWMHDGYFVAYIVSNDVEPSYWCVPGTLLDF